MEKNQASILTQVKEGLAQHVKPFVNA